MKKNQNFLWSLGLVAALAVGFVVGLLIEYPFVDSNEMTGTIARVNNFRNTKVSEGDLALQNNLATDTLLQKSMQSYMKYQYVRSIQLGESIDEAILASKATPDFSAKTAQIIREMEGFSSFLQKSRPILLTAALSMHKAREADAAALRNIIAQASNVVTEMNYRNRMVFDYLNSAEAFIVDKGAENCQDLAVAHDKLATLQLGSALVSADKVSLKLLDKKRVFGHQNESSVSANLKSVIKWDIEFMSIHLDVEKLGFLDKEQLAGWDQEQLAVHDQEQLGMVKDQEQLGWWDQEQLGLKDFEQLAGVVALDMEVLAGIGALDQEKLGIIVPMDQEKLAYFADAEALGLHNSSEQLKGQPLLFDVESLRTGFTDTEKLGTGFTDVESLAGIGALDQEKLGITFFDAEELSGFFDAEKLSGGLW